MSTLTPPRPLQDSEEERLPFGKVVGVGVVSLLVLFAGCVFAGVLLVRGQGALSAAPVARPAPGIGQRRIGLVTQGLQEGDDRALRLRQAQERRLASHGWVDRPAGLVHVPIEAAMEELLRESSR